MDSKHPHTGETVMKIAENTQQHWALYSLSVYQSKVDEEGAKMAELFEQIDGLFRSKQDLSPTLSVLARKKGLLGRENTLENRAYRYYLNSNGKEMLRKIGMPTETPDGEPVDMELPDLVYDVETEPEINVTDDPDEAGHSAGPFESAKARRRFFAEKDRQEYIEWLEEEWAPNNRVENDADEVEDEADEVVKLNAARYGGEVNFEGEEELAEQWLQSDPKVEQADITPPTVDPESEIPETISFEPVWDWVGTQMAKLGFPGLARQAYLGNLTPRVIYGDVMNLICDNRWNGEVDLDLTYGPSGLTAYEVAADPEEVKAYKRGLGINPEFNANEDDPNEVNPHAVA